MRVRLLLIAIVLIFLGLYIPEFFPVTFLGLLLLFPAILSGRGKGPPNRPIPRTEQTYSQARPAKKPEPFEISSMEMSPGTTAYAAQSSYGTTAATGASITLPVLFADPILPAVNPLQVQKQELPSKTPAAEDSGELIQLLLLLGVLKFISRK
jgi:hypothetical protein